MDANKFLDAIIHNLKGAVGRFADANEILSKKYNLPEIDWVREEIAKCYCIDAFHSVITSTNYILESYCKYLLIVEESEIKIISDIKTLDERFRPYMDKYCSMKLSETLKACKEKGFITEKRYNILDEYRKTKRNAFGHANWEQVTGKLGGMFIMRSLKGEFEPVQAMLSPGSIPFLSGIAVQAVAERDAWPYFLEGRGVYC